MKINLLFLLTLCSVLGRAQTITGYRSATLADGSQQVWRLYSDGSRVAVQKLPSDAVRGRFGGTVRVPYAPEPPATINFTQFGTGRYFDPNFYMCVDLTGQYSLAQQRGYGTNLFSPWSLPESARGDMARGEGFGYITEAQVYGGAAGRGVYELSLADYYKLIYDRVPSMGQGGDSFFAKCVLVAYNIEASGFWGRNYYVNDWDQKKATSIVCEFDGQTRTLEQIDAQNLWDVEYSKRFANRMVLLTKLTRERSASDIKLMWGSSMHQYFAKIDLRGVNHAFQNFSCDVSHIGGDGSGNITLNAPDGTPKSYKLTGSVWDQEDAMHGYYYWFNFDIASQDYNDIWVDHKAGTQTYPYLWSKIQPINIVADEKGYLQQNREQMRLNQGKTRPIIRLSAMAYEGDVPGRVNGVPVAARAPFAQLQNALGFDTPKPWQPPYMFYSRYAVTRFFAGAEPGWGFHVFPITTSRVYGDLSQVPWYQHHLHSYTAIFQARADLQWLESWYAGSTFVEDPEVQQTDGSWLAYDGPTAFNATTGGGFGPQKPAFLLRYKQTVAGWTVVVLGGTNQAHGAESTYTVRVPGGALNGNVFRITLRGPSAQLFEFSVDKSDNSVIYTGAVAAGAAFERAGYSGRTAAN